MFVRIRVGDRLPNATLAWLVSNRIARVPLQELCGRRNVIIVGVPGAFTPTCTRYHIPGYVAQADRLRVSGIDDILCVAPNDPWSLAEWGQKLDPAGKLRFLSDGNGEFAEMAGLATRDRDNFLGQTMRRFSLVAVAGMVHRLNVEHDLIGLTCTRAEDLPADEIARAATATAVAVRPEA